MIWINNISFQLLTNMNIACFVILPVLMCLHWNRMCISQHNLARYIWFLVIEIRVLLYHCLLHKNIYGGTLWFSHRYPATLTFAYTSQFSLDCFYI